MAAVRVAEAGARCGWTRGGKMRLLRFSFLMLPAVLFLALGCGDDLTIPGIDVGFVDPGSGDPGLPGDPGGLTDFGFPPDPGVPIDPGVAEDPGAPSDSGVPTDSGVDTPTDPGALPDPGTDTPTDPGPTDVPPADTGSTDAVEIPCDENDDCDGVFPDLSECRKAVCDPVARKCVTEDLVNQTPCGLYNLCILNGKCLDGVCVGGAPDCIDDNPCTTDSCDPTTGCVHTLMDEGAECDDGLPCTINDRCLYGQEEGDVYCEGETNCPTDDPCMLGSCDPDSRECEFEFRGENTPCDDGDGCTVNDRCVWEEKGCIGEPRACPTGNPCTVSVCVDGECGAPVSVADGTTCATDVCKTGMTCLTGICQGGTLISCDDGNVCTDDFCAAGEGCRFVVDTTNACDDGNKCTHTDLCTGATTCAGTPYSCTTLNPSCDGNGGCNCRGDFCDVRSNYCSKILGCRCTTNPKGEDPCPKGTQCTMLGCQ